MQPWPSHFQPAPVADSSERSLVEPLPVSLLDVFFLRRSRAARPQLMAILSCLGGGIVATPVSEATPFAPAIQAQLTTASVQTRGQFRVLTARELWIATLDAVDQAVETSGLNDPVYLYGTLQWLAEADERTVSLSALNQPGSATVGRLDLLAACAGASATGLQLAERDAFVYQLLLPLGPGQLIEQGQALGLFYPTLDPAVFASPDNRVVLLRIAYELLARLQQDLHVELPNHPFTKLLLPVPSRQRLEAELVADGYRIQGNSALKATGAPGRPAAGVGFLTHLRSLAESWFAPEIPLPAQATPEGYQALIAGILPLIATAADQAMMHALVGIVEPLGGPPPAPVVRSSAGVVTTPLAPPSRAARAAPQPGAQPKRPPPQREAWADDFQAAGPARSTATVRLDRDEWARDTLAERSSGPVGSDQGQGNAHSWRGDFATTPPPSKPPIAEDDWSDDFAS